jgi:chromosomal replication initiation ATPase DnaA
MNIPAIAADIASRIPAMAGDSPINNASVIERLIADAMQQTQPFPTQASVTQIIDIVAEAFNVTREQILSHSRPEHLVWPRHLAIYLAHIHSGHTQNILGRLFHRDHGAIYYAVKAAIDRISTNPVAKEQFHALDEKLLKSLHSPLRASPHV